MKIYTDNKRAFIVSFDGITEWPFSKALKIAQTHYLRPKPFDNHILTWENIDDIASTLTNRIPYKFTHVTCPPGRGGLVPAALFAYRLQLPYVPFSEAPNERTTVCVDDILDTGHTIKSLFNQKPNIYYTALVARWEERIMVGRILNTPEYIIFPWDTPSAEGEDHP